VTAASFTKDNHTLYTSSTDGTVIGWDIGNLNNLGSQLRPPGSGPIRWMAVSPTGEIALEYPDGTVRFWDSTSTSPTRPIQISDGELNLGAFSPDGHLFATSDIRGTARLVGVRSHMIKTVAQMKGPRGAVAFRPDGRRMVWVDEEGIVRYFDAATLQQLGPAQVFQARTRELVWSPDSRYIAATTRNRTRFRPFLFSEPVGVFDTNTNTERWSHHGFQGVAWSPDAATVAVGGDAATGILLLRASDGTTIGGRWRDHADIVAVAYSPDGSTIASTGADGTVVLRDVATGTQVGPALIASYNQRAYVSFDAAGHLVVATVDGGLWRWNIDLGYLLHRACAIAGRNLTTQEWADLQTARPYLTACD
jgi:WD40 repeat protein